MFRSTLLKLIWAALFVILSQSGCSVIGFGVGSLVDSSKPDSLIMRGDQVINTETGKDVTVFLKSGGIVAGKFGGVKLMPVEEYSNNYNEYCDNIADSLYLPRYGDTVDIIVASGPELTRRFAGFDYRISSLEQHAGDPSSGYIAVDFLDGSVRSRVYLSEILRIAGPEGASIERAFLEELLYENELPMLSFAIIYNTDYSKEIALNKIDYVKTANRKNSKYYGLGMGLTLDAAMIYIGASGWGFGIQGNLFGY